MRHECEFLDATGDVVISVVIDAIDEFEASEKCLELLGLFTDADDFQFVRSE